MSRFRPGQRVVAPSSGCATGRFDAVVVDTKGDRRQVQRVDDGGREWCYVRDLQYASDEEYESSSDVDHASDDDYTEQAAPVARRGVQQRADEDKEDEDESAEEEASDEHSEESDDDAEEEGDEERDSGPRRKRLRPSSVVDAHLDCEPYVPSVRFSEACQGIGRREFRWLFRVTCGDERLKNDSLQLFR
jgi:hypothetical protein